MMGQFLTSLFFKLSLSFAKLQFDLKMICNLIIVPQKQKKRVKWDHDLVFNHRWTIHTKRDEIEILKNVSMPKLHSPLLSMSIQVMRSQDTT